MTTAPRTLYLLTQTSQGLRAQLEKALCSLEITGLQYTVLSIVAARGGLSSSDLSRWFFVTPQTMNEIVIGLHRRGMLERKNDAKNRRTLRMTLSPAGRKLLANCHSVADLIEADAFAALAPQQLRQLRRVLSSLLMRLGEKNAVELPLHAPLDRAPKHARKPAQKITPADKRRLPINPTRLSPRRRSTLAER
jgi:DNA-binding MarR family transcriptional regulator